MLESFVPDIPNQSSVNTNLAFRILSRSAKGRCHAPYHPIMRDMAHTHPSCVAQVKPVVQRGVFESWFKRWPTRLVCLNPNCTIGVEKMRSQVRDTSEKAIFFHSIAQGMPGQTQQACGFARVVFSLVQCGANQAPFYVF